MTPGIFLCSSACSAWFPGRRPWTVVSLVVGGRARGSGAGRFPWSWGRHGAGEPRGVVCGLPSSFAGVTPALWASTAASVDVAPFLKASMRRRSVCLRAPGENPRSLDRAVAALRRRALLEDTVLKPTARGSPKVVTEVILRRSAARLAPCPPLVELPWRCCSVCEQRGLTPGGGRLPVALLRRRSSIEARVKMARSRVSSGPTL